MARTRDTPLDRTVYLYCDGPRLIAMSATSRDRAVPPRRPNSIGRRTRVVEHRSVSVRPPVIEIRHRAGLRESAGPRATAARAGS